MIAKLVASTADNLYKSVRRKYSHMRRLRLKASSAWPAVGYLAKACCHSPLGKTTNWSELQLHRVSPQ
jgi:hypothetical protein